MGTTEAHLLVHFTLPAPTVPPLTSHSPLTLHLQVFQTKTAHVVSYGVVSFCRLSGTTRSSLQLSSLTQTVVNFTSTSTENKMKAGWVRP